MAHYLKIQRIIFSTGVLVRLTSKKLSDGSRDTLTVELVGGFLATTMQLSSKFYRTSSYYKFAAILFKSSELECCVSNGRNITIRHLSRKYSIFAMKSW